MPGKILIVEDERSVREALASYLGFKGFEVETAGDGETGLRLVSQQGGYDLVITDLSMPGMHGLDFLHRLRKMGENLPVIVMTGYATVENAVQALKEGAEDFVTKPIHFEELAESIARILERHARKLQRYDALRLAEGFTLQLTYRTSQLDLRSLRYYFEDLLIGLNGFTQVEVTSVTLAFEEALSNAHEHGNLELSSDVKSAEGGGWEAYDRLRRERLAEPKYGNRKMHLRISWQPPVVEVSVRDEGRGFNYADWAPQTDSTKGHGRGLAIIYGVMDEVSFNESGTEITMRKFTGPTS